MYTFKYDVDELNAVVKYIKENNPYIPHRDENYILDSIRGCINNWDLVKPMYVGTLGFRIHFEESAAERDTVYVSFTVELFYPHTTKDYATYVPGQSTTTYRL